MYTKLWLTKLKDNPRTLFVGVCIFCTAVMGTSVHNVASTAFALLLIASFSILPQWIKLWRQLNPTEKMFLIGFALYAISGVIAYINVENTHEYIKTIERYLRFFAATPIYLYIKKYKVNVMQYLYAGAIASGPFLFFIALRSYMANPALPAAGQYHHIIFGAVAMLNVGVMLAMLLTLAPGKLSRFFILVAMVCGLIAAVLSQSRGVWLVLPIYIIIALYYSFRSRCQKVNFGLIILISVFFFGAVFVSPVGNMVKNRVSEAVKNVSAYYNNDLYVTSVGTRLALWSIAVHEWEKDPIVGSGPGDFDDTIRALQKEGKYKGMEVLNSVHSIYFQSLFNAGIIGFCALIFGIIYMPLKIMFTSSPQVKNISLVGTITVLLFLVSGLSMSWIIRAPTVAVYILYMIVVVSSMYSLDNNSDRTEYNKLFSENK